MECLRLRVKNLDFENQTIAVRSGKGDKDREAILPSRLIKSMQHQSEHEQLLHEHDMNHGHGSVAMPYSLARKYPDAQYELAWKFVSQHVCRVVIPVPALYAAIIFIRAMSSRQ
jgi:integrase